MGEFQRQRQQNIVKDSFQGKKEKEEKSDYEISFKQLGGMQQVQIC